MKLTLSGLTLIVLTAVAGCTQGTPGGPGVKEVTSDKPIVGQAEDTFNLSVPVLESSLKQGDVMEATIGIQRAKNFDQDVTLSFADVPSGVTVDPEKPEIKHGDKDVKVTFKAGDDAATGDFKVKVTGHPTKGGDAVVDFKLGVAAKDSFSLSMPLLATSIKQGEKKTVAIDIKRQKSFDLIGVVRRASGGRSACSRDFAGDRPSAAPVA